MAETLRRRISEETYKREDSVPSETRLAAEFCVSRFAVGEALRRLSDAGLICGQQGARSCVPAAAPVPACTSSVGSAEDLQRYAFQTCLEILDVAKIAARGQVARFPCCQDDPECLLISGVRRDADEDRIVGYTEVYPSAEFADHIADITACGRPIHQLIEKHLLVTAANIRQEISAIAMPDAAAALLKCDAGSLALEIVRR